MTTNVNTCTHTFISPLCSDWLYLQFAKQNEIHIGMEIFEYLDWLYDIVPSKLCQSSTPHHILLSYNAKEESWGHDASCLIRNQLGLKGVIVPPILIEPVALLPQHTRGSNCRASSKMLVVLLTVALLALSSAQRPNEGMQIGLWGWGSCLGYRRPYKCKGDKRIKE